MFKYLFAVLSSWFYYVKGKFTRKSKSGFEPFDEGQQSALGRTLSEQEKAKRRGEVLGAIAHHPEMLVDALNLMYDFRDMVNKLEELHQDRCVGGDDAHEYISGVRQAGMIVQPRCPDVDPRLYRRIGIEHHCLNWEMPDRVAHVRAMVNQQEQDNENKIKEFENSVLN